MTLKPMLAALLMTTALPAAAQTGPAAPAAAPMMMHHDPAMMQRHRAAMMQHVADMQKRHADDLALLLDLKPAQRPALDAFLKAAHPRMDMDEGMGPMGQRAGGEPADGAAPPPTFTERLDRMDQAATRRADAQHQRIAALKAFYQSLDPHQRQLFEAVMRLHHGGGMHGGMGGMGGNMRGGHPGPDDMDGPGAPQD